MKYLILLFFPLALFAKEDKELKFTEESYKMIVETAQEPLIDLIKQNQDQMIKLPTKDDFDNLGEKMNERFNDFKGSMNTTFTLWGGLLSGLVVGAYIFGFFIYRELRDIKEKIIQLEQ